MNNIISIITSIIVFLSDFVFKNKIEKDASPEKQMLGGHITITRLHNKGVMLGKLSGKPLLVKYLISGAMIVLYIIYIPLLFKKGLTLVKLGFGMFVGGAWSNFYDHFVRGYVVDYIRIPHGFFKKIVFNLGDFFIALGAIIAGFFSLFS